jgi:hypothetical protein
MGASLGKEKPIQLGEKRRAGLVGGMGDVIMAMATAQKVLALS